MGTVAGAVLVTAASLGCSGGPANGPPPTTAASTTAPAEDDVADGLMEHHRHHHHGGVTLFIAMSLDTLGVSPDQQAAVEKLRTELHARMAAARSAEQSLVATLADGVSAGSVDATKVDAGVAQVTTAASAVHDATVDALNELHRVLTPVQRAALVDKVEAHWAVWQKSNVADVTRPGGYHLDRLAAELDLTADQVERIRAGLGDGMRAVPRLDPQEIAAHLRAFGEAFRAEKFEARALATANSANAHLVGWGAAHMARLVETASPVLTPEQRARFAERLREHAGHDPSAQGNP